MLATAKTRITTPMLTNTRIAPIPSSQGHTLRFCVCGVGVGDQAGGVLGGGVGDHAGGALGGGVWPG